MNKRILACGEFSQLSTGYAVYMRGLLNKLHSMGYIVAELAVGCAPNDPRLVNVPWGVFCNSPNPEDKEAVHRYQNSFGAEYGSWQFEQAVNIFKPDVVLDIRDPWHFEFELRSPLRDYYASVIMPAIDAAPQHKGWLNMYSEADAVLSYTDWGIQLLKNSGFNINVVGSTPPMAAPEYQPLNKEQVKKHWGLENKLIVGMVGRNQKRKLFPDLFASFAEFLKISKRTDTYLYIHTKYPDRGWNIDEELLKYGISNKTYLTYYCQNCKDIRPSLYKGMAGPCYNCGYANSCVTANSDVGIPNQAMAMVYNCMDLYVQWATNEGYGIPAMEALACGVPICGVDYSAVSEVIKNGGGHAIAPKGYYQELETGRMMAVPDNEALANYMNQFFSLPSQMRTRANMMARMYYTQNWSDDACYGNWIKAIDNAKPAKPWNAQPNLHQIPNDYPRGLDNVSFARWLILDVLNRPKYIGKEMEARLIRDLNDGITHGGFANQFYHEVNAADLHKVPYQNFNQEIAFNIFRDMARLNEVWEKARLDSLR